MNGLLSTMTVYSKFGLPGAIISDRDPKFTSQFWKDLFKRTGVRLALTAAYHPSADGQSERTNQTVETALRCLIADSANERPISEWDEELPEHLKIHPVISYVHLEPALPEHLIARPP